MHAPIQDLDLTGFTQQGWNEFERKTNVNKLVSSVDRAHQMDPQGNVPVTVHAGGTFAQRWQKEGLETEEGKPIPDARSEMVIVNQDTGQVQLTQYKKKKYFGGEEQVWTPERLMNNLNANEWAREELQIMQWKKGMHEVQDRTQDHLTRINIPALEYAKKHGIATPQEIKQLDQLREKLGLE